VIASQQRLPPHFSQARNMFEREMAEDKFHKETGLFMSDWEYNLKKMDMLEDKRIQEIGKSTEEKMKAFITDLQKSAQAKVDEMNKAKGVLEKKDDHHDHSNCSHNH
jgi:hypothetical protein